MVAIRIVIFLVLFFWLALRGIEKPWKLAARPRRSKFAIDLVLLLQLTGLFAVFLPPIPERANAQQVTDLLIVVIAIVVFIVLPTAIVLRWAVEDSLYAFGPRVPIQKEFDAGEIAAMAAHLDDPPPLDPSRPPKRLKLSPFCPNVPTVRLSEFSTISSPLK
jgi:small-conductance mechanosensitive channel